MTVFKNSLLRDGPVDYPWAVIFHDGLRICHGNWMLAFKAAVTDTP
jgi:hypothetical protein